MENFPFAEKPVKKASPVQKTPPTSPDSAVPDDTNNEWGVVTITFKENGVSRSWTLCGDPRADLRWAMWENPGTCAALKQQPELLETFGLETNDMSYSVRPDITIRSRQGTIHISPNTSGTRVQRWSAFEKILGPTLVRREFDRLKSMST